MRIVAVDFGRTNIGLATGDSASKVASPRKPLRASGTLQKDATAIREFAKNELAEAIVFGLPTIGGEETKGSKIVMRLAQMIEGIPVKFVDEEFTSQQAEDAMIEAGLKASQRRAASDGEAACRILERFFENG